MFQNQDSSKDEDLNREMPAETKTVQEPHSLVISHESLSRAFREDPFEFFVGMRPRRGLKLRVMLRPLLATTGYQTMSMMAPVCA